MEHHQFYEVLPDGRYRFRVDHHTIDDHNKCERYFKFRHIPDANGLVWATKGTSIKVALGSWWSSVMESFYHEMQFGACPDDATTVRIAVDAWKAHNMEQYKNTEPDVFDKFGGLDGAMLMALEYKTAFGAAHFQQWQIIGAELGFGWRDELLLGEDDKVVVYYGGKPDLVILDRAQNMIMPLDFKTKDSVPSNASAKYKPHPQTTGYIFAVREMLTQLKLEQTNSEEVNQLANLPKASTKCVVMVCARFRPSDKPRSGIRAPRFLPVPVSYDASEIEEWRNTVVEKCRRLRDSIERGMWVPREGDSSCHLYYHGCPFRRVCSVPNNVREAVLKADFVKIEPWVPYHPEED
jgi:hypothetical protein